MASAEGEVPEEYKGFGYEHKVTSTTPLYMIDFENMAEGEYFYVKVPKSEEIMARILNSKDSFDFKVNNIYI